MEIRLDLPGFSGVTRAVLLFLGALGLLWSSLTLPTFWNEFPAEQFAEYIVRGETFPLNTLREAARVFRDGSHLTACNAAVAHDSALFELAILNQSFATPSGGTLDSQLKTSRNAILAGLSCLPSDAFLWFALFQVESLQSGFQPGYLRHLAMSYQVGANEGWIAIPRNKAAFAIFPALPDELKSKVLDEFCLLVRTELYEQAIGIFLGAGRPYQDLIAKRLETVPERPRQLFAVLLARMGIDPHIPGTSIVIRERPHFP